MGKRKIINDAVHGFISIPNDFLYELLQHRFMQRLNRIKQLGVSAMVYPSATHTRFQHSLGAMHLTSEAVKELRLKGHNISDDEEKAVMAAILLHDIGHCPYSHVLENIIVGNIRHERISDILMQQISDEMGGQLDTAIRIFRNEYPKHFLHQLISSQLDMDRFDYLMRDSFFTGVVEGSIGSARIIKMLDVADDSLVVEQKGMLSVENYLISRRFMYWQVYFHKTSIAAEIMLRNIIRRAKELIGKGQKLFGTPALLYFLENDINAANFDSDELAIEKFAEMDDADIIASIKVWSKHNDKVLAILSRNFIDRRLFKTSSVAGETDRATLEHLAREKEKDIVSQLGIDKCDGHYFSSYQIVENDTYNFTDDKIMVRLSDGSISDLSASSSILTPQSLHYDTRKCHLCYYQA
ncbi:HD domain protein [Bacteroidetes oral taxon 274 str. F0058]|nr:HD domain protein [Bacteroidetes oral taxon 274 str. F0058]